MALITAERFNNLKSRVKAECARRCNTGSVAEYSSSAYDYTNTPAANKTIAKEHFEKIATPMNAINSDDTPDTSGNRIINDTEMTTMEAKITIYESTSLQSSNTGCKASCTGLCSTTCTGGCSGCSGCSGQCGGCSGCSGCGDSCSDDCTGGCGGVCSSNCTGGCKEVCKGGCNGCGSGCSGGCKGDCKGCGDSCSAGCGDYCMACGGVVS